MPSRLRYGGIDGTVAAHRAPKGHLWVRIDSQNMLMYYVIVTFFEEPEMDWLNLQENLIFESPEPPLFPD